MKTAVDMMDIPEYVLTLDALARTVGVPRSTLGDIRRADSRFPAPDPVKGWPVFRVAALLEARELERLSIADYTAREAERCRGLLASIEAGTLPGLPAGGATRALVRMLESGAAGHGAAEAREQDIAAALAHAAGTE
jgi:hypothetical protein